MCWHYIQKGSAGNLANKYSGCIAETVKDVRRDVHCLIVLSRLNFRLYAFAKEQSDRVMIQQTQCICICSLHFSATFLNLYQLVSDLCPGVRSQDSDLAYCFLLRCVKFRCLIRIISRPFFFHLQGGKVDSSIWKRSGFCSFVASNSSMCQSLSCHPGFVL